MLGVVENVAFFAPLNCDQGECKVSWSKSEMSLVDILATYLNEFFLLDLMTGGIGTWFSLLQISQF